MCQLSCSFVLCVHFSINLQNILSSRSYLIWVFHRRRTWSWVRLKKMTKVLGGIKKKKFNVLCLKVCLNLDSILVTWIRYTLQKIDWVYTLDLKHNQTISPVWNVKKKIMLRKFQICAYLIYNNTWLSS